MNATGRFDREGLPPGRIVPGSTGIGGFVRITEGTGTPIVLLHGWSANADLNFTSVFPALAGRTVIAPDLRGHTDGPRGPFSLEAAATDVAQLLDDLGTGPAIVVGYSMGGAIAQHLTALRPDLVAGTVYAATAAQFTTTRTWALFRAAAAAGWLAPRLPGTSFATVVNLTLNRSRPIPPTWTWAASDIARHDWSTVFDAALALERHDGRSLITQTIPAAVVLTSDDRTIPPFRQHELARLAAAPVFPIPTGHAAPVTAGDQLGTAILAATTHLDRVLAGWVTAA